MVVVGVGATGGLIATLLARAGVGRLTLVDRDVPELHNLQRQLLLDTEDVRRGTPKALAAAEALRRVDETLDIRPQVADVHAGNVRDLVGGHDVLCDGTDSFTTRLVLNDAAVALEVPWVYCGAVGAHGSVMPIAAGGRPCLRCLYPEAPPPGSVETCDTAGVLGPAVATVAGLAALAAMKVLLAGKDAPANAAAGGSESGDRETGDRAPGDQETGDRDANADDETAAADRRAEDIGYGELVHVDAWTAQTARFAVPERADCAACGTRSFPGLRVRDGGDVVAASLCGREAVHLRPPPQAVDLAQVGARLAGATEVMLAGEHVVRFAADGCEVTLFDDGRAIVHGTDDPAKARSIYARWVGV